ncbi:MAG: hypothetical protein G4V63_05900, partial [Candidatus Afipia apatlaquensis]|nr:hypothetical protein [Candidatus Afipia apatlaquensis]
MLRRILPPRGGKGWNAVAVVEESASGAKPAGVIARLRDVLTGTSEASLT